jgi:hypothetical protein
VRLTPTVDVLGRKAVDFGFQPGYCAGPIRKLDNEHLDIRQQERFELMQLEMWCEAP